MAEQAGDRKLDPDDVLDDTSALFGPGPCTPQDANLPTAIDALRQESSAMQSWLRNAGELDAATLKNFLASRVVYYPGSGTDWQAIQIFGRSHAACCFVHADYHITAGTVGDELGSGPGGHPLAGYTLIVQELVQPEMLREALGFDYGRQFDLPPKFDDGQPKPGLWAILKRDDNLGDDHGPERLAFLHLCAEAVWVYWNLWGRFEKGGPYAMVLQNHGFGSNWTTFGDIEEPLYQLAAQSDLPQWLLVAKNTRCWPEFGVASDWLPPAGSEGHRRRLWKRLSQNGGK